MIDNILQMIESQSPFLQGLIAATIFAFTTWLFRVLKRKALKSGSKFMQEYQKLELTKHYIHKNYVRGQSIEVVNHGINIVSFQAFRFSILAVLVIILFWGINSILNENWLYVVASWFSFNLFFEAHTWLKDKSNPNVIDGISDDIKENFYSSLSSKSPESKNCGQTKNISE